MSVLYNITKKIVLQESFGDVDSLRSARTLNPGRACEGGWPETHRGFCGSDVFPCYNFLYVLMHVSCKLNRD